MTIKTNKAQNISIVRRVSITVIVLMIFTALLSVSTTFWHIKNQLEQEFREKLNDGVELLASSLVHPIWSFDKDNASTICNAFALNQEVVLINVVAPGFEHSVCSYSKKGNSDVFYLKEDITYEGQVIGEVAVGISSKNFDKSMSSVVAFNLFILLVITIAVIISLNWILKQFLAQPLSILGQWAVNLSSGLYNSPWQNIKERELQPLAEQFMNMADKIATREMDLKKLSLATEQSPSGVMITDTTGKVEYVNQAFERLNGYGKQELIGSYNATFNSDITPKTLKALIWQEISSGRTWSGELQNEHRNGALIWENTRIAPIKNEQGVVCHFVIVSEDITIRKQQEEQIVKQAHYDSLTGLPNRFLCIDRLKCVLKEAERDKQYVSVLFLDLDDFKKINDTLGHATGDELLVLAGQRLQNCLRKCDTVGRLGGDEFIVIAGNLPSASSTASLASNLIKEFRAPLLLDDREFLLTISIGIASFPVDGKNEIELLKNADTAMYQSKKEGRNTFNFFTQSMNAQVSRKLLLEQRLRGAIERNELDVHYQLIIDCETGMPSGAEALVRWNSPELGNISPNEFIPVAEQNGLIVPIGMFVLQKAVNSAVRWRSMSEWYSEFKISVNLSPRQFRSKDLLAEINSILSVMGVTGDILALEITEGVLMSGHLNVAQVLSKLTSAGIELSMDDFGTGYSSLSYLRTFPFSRLKIDRSFVQDLLRNRADHELVFATVKMANALGLKVVAEGVETSRHYIALKKIGCDYAQGYYFNKPCDEDSFTQLLKESCQKNVKKLW